LVTFVAALRLKSLSTEEVSELSKPKSSRSASSSLPLLLLDGGRGWGVVVVVVGVVVAIVAVVAVVMAVVCVDREGTCLFGGGWCWVGSALVVDGFCIDDDRRGGGDDDDVDGDGVTETGMVVGLDAKRVGGGAAVIAAAGVGNWCDGVFCCAAGVECNGGCVECNGGCEVGG